MKIEIVSQTTWEDLEIMMRKVPLLKTTRSDGSPVFVYENADISLRAISTEEVNPTSFYALHQGLRTQRELRRALLDQYGIDTLALTGLLRLRLESGEEIGLMPPVVEVQTRRVHYAAKEGEIRYDHAFDIKIPLINDGLHRFMIAREERSRVNVAYIVGANPEYPFYAHPNEWERVNVVDKVPGTKEEKKLYSREDCNALYRNFGIFGCGAPRGTGK